MTELAVGIIDLVRLSGQERLEEGYAAGCESDSGSSGAVMIPR